MAKRTKRREQGAPVVWAYLRVSTDRQSLENQEHEILKHSNERGWTVKRWIENTASTRRAEKERKLDVLREGARAGEFNILVCTELTRLGRRMSECIGIVLELQELGVAVHLIKDKLDTASKDPETLLKLAMFAYFAEVERRLISERTKTALAARKAAGVKLGRPKGKSKLDVHEHDIRQWLEDGVRQTRIAKNVGCSAQTLCVWLKRKLPEWRAAV